MAGLGSVNFGGLYSGLDTQKIIEDLMNVDSLPVRRLEKQKEDLTTKRDTFTSMNSNLLELKNSVAGLKSSTSFGAFSASSSDEEALTLSASSSANAGTYNVKVLSLAQAETLSSSSYTQTNSRLNLKGEILVNGSSFSIKKTDTLADIRNGINALDKGVNASLLQVTDNDNRLIISSETQGEEGLIIANVGSTDILGSLGITDGTKGIRKLSGGNVLSSEFNSATATIGSLVGISSNVSGNVAIRGESFRINLSKDTLSTIRDEINNLDVSDVSASIESVEDGTITSYRLAITGTENFTDDNNILETLGILEGGKSGTETEFETGTLRTVNNNGNGKGNGNGRNNSVAESTTRLNDLGSAAEDSTTETVTISGTNANGSSVSKSITITSDTTITDILTGIEDAFSGDVTASVDDGKIVIRNNVSGESSLDVNIQANNENNGTLDFGTINQTMEGRERQIVAGSDAKIVVNNVKVTRSSNELNDVLTGLNITLKKADPDTVISLTVERNDEDIQKKIEGFVSSYNALIDYIDENSTYDEETKEGGPLLGDQTTRSILYRIQNAMRTTVNNGEFMFNQLAQIGIESTLEGKLELDTSILRDAMDNDMESIVSLFTATRQSSDNDLTFVYHSEASKSGTYDVTITQAAEQASVVSDNAGVASEDGTVIITDNYDRFLSFDYTEDMSFTDIANSIMTEAEKEIEGIFKSSEILYLRHIDDPANQNTKIDDISGVTINDGDTITINATNRLGRGYQRIITLDEDDEMTIQDILDTFEYLTDNRVQASVDANGRLQIQDLKAGDNNYSFSIETTVQGLTFGDFVEEQVGRGIVNVDVSVNDDNRLVISHKSYGTTKTFTLTGASGLGIDDGEYAGIDVAGTINGVEGTGNGQSLNASSTDANSRGIVIQSDITPEELADEGESQGTISLISGVADLVYSELQSITSPINGFVKAKIDGFERTILSLDTRIEQKNDRLETKRAMYVRRFTELERAMAQLDAMQQRLSSALSALPTASIFS